jgi:DNA-binding beta-propeller fold protein YncE
MSLQLSRYVNLPDSKKPGGFDHAAVHRASARVYVAHTANDALDVLDAAAGGFLHSIPGLTGVAGALVSDQDNLVFTSNRGENTVGIFSPGDEMSLAKVPVGLRPNGLAYDPGRGRLLAANVGDPAVPGSFTLSIVDVKRRELATSIPVPGRTRWTVFDKRADVFYVNIADPAQVVVVEAQDATRMARVFDIPAAGPHGLDLDHEHQRLFCACDAAKLLTVDTQTGLVLSEHDLSGAPDVIFFNAALRHLYVAVGDPGVIDVFDTMSMQRLESVPTEKGAHTIAFDPDRNKVYAFLPQMQSAAVYSDLPGA